MKPRRLSVVAQLLTPLLAAGLLSIGALTMEFVLAPQASAMVVTACGVTDAAGQNNIFQGSEAFGIFTTNGCSGGGGLGIESDDVNTVPDGAVSTWIATAPSGLNIVGAYASMTLGSGTVGTGWVANFIWTGAPPHRVDNTSGNNFTIPPGGMSSGQYGFNLECAPSQGGSCKPSFSASFIVDDLQLTVNELWGPTISPVGGGSNDLWSQGSVGDPSGTRWVRGSGWLLPFSGTAPSGVCGLVASVNGAALPNPPGWGQDPTQWVQCAGNGQVWTPTVSLGGNGDQPLALSAGDAAGNGGGASETIHVDSVQPTVALSGPADASSSAGTQYVTATATVGNSGLGAISCSVDQGPEQSYASSPAQIPVAGLGQHSIDCTASNRSFNSAGQVAVSPPASFSMDIGAPTAGSVSFGNIIHGLKCRKVIEREKIPGKWVMVRRHGKFVRVHRRAHTKRVKAMKCRERFVKRKVIELVKVKRHGKTVIVKRTKVEKVPVPPQAVSSSTKRVSYGQGTTVSGILATTDGTALPGRTVQVLAAPNNQLGQWSQVAVVTTGADGTWSATLPPGPSRLVEASYAGDTTTLPSTSNTVMMVVPARIKITITPHQLPWNGVLTIHGHLAGGYIPPDGVAMRVLIGLPHLPHPYLAQSFRTNAAGAFALKFKAFGGGHGATRYPVWLATTSNESDYAYAKSSSRRIKITFGRRTPKKKGSHHKKHKKAKKRRHRKRRR